MAYTQQQLDEIQITQEQRGLTRKSAVQFCVRKWKREAAEAAKATKAQPKNDSVTVPGIGSIELVPAAQVAASNTAALDKAAKALAKTHKNQPHEQRKPKAKPADDTRLSAPTPEEAKQIVKLYKGGEGMSIPDLAEKFGRRDKGNRIRRVLTAAGVYQGKCSKYYGGE
jgi:hypothetical protein